MIRRKDLKAGKHLILLLNADYLPINVTTVKKAFKLIVKGKATTVKEDVENIISTENEEYFLPSVIRLKYYVSVPYRKVIMSRENIFKRDDYTCAYCGAKDKTKLTIDHIHPKSKGGKNSWTNLITCCKRCNSYKGDKTLKECHLELLYEPFAPNPASFIYSSYSKKDGWGEYLMA